MATMRAVVYDVIDGERAYQETLPPTRSEDPLKVRPTGEYLVMLKEYVDRAFTAWVDTPGDKAALHVVRKIAAIAVRCMEDNGAPRRSGF